MDPNFQADNLREEMVPPQDPARLPPPMGQYSYSVPPYSLLSVNDVANEIFAKFRFNDRGNVQGIGSSLNTVVDPPDEDLLRDQMVASPLPLDETADGPPYEDDSSA